MGEVVDLGCSTTLEIPPNKVLQAALDAGLKTVIIIGERDDGEPHFASSSSDLPLVNWLLDCAKSDLLKLSQE